MARSRWQLLAFAILGSGCAAAGRYARDRGLDLVDGFQLEGGVGIGVDVDAHATDWIATGAGLSGLHMWGLAGRHLVGFDHSASAPYPGDHVHIGFPVAPFIFWLSSERTPLDAMGLRGLCTDVCARNTVVGFASGEARSKESASFLLVNLCPFLGCAPSPEARWIHAFDLELGASAFLGVRVGFRPGQLLDFLLGWTTLDIAGDDAGPGPQPQSEPRPQPESEPEPKPEPKPEPAPAPERGAESTPADA